jgi:hypothetical protein
VGVATLNELQVLFRHAEAIISAAGLVAGSSSFDPAKST